MNIILINLVGLVGYAPTTFAMLMRHPTIKLKSLSPHSDHVRKRRMNRWVTNIDNV